MNKLTSFWPAIALVVLLTAGIATADVQIGVSIDAIDPDYGVDLTFWGPWIQIDELYEFLVEVKWVKYPFMGSPYVLGYPITTEQTFDLSFLRYKKCTRYAFCPDNLTGTGGVVDIEVSVYSIDSGNRVGYAQRRFEMSY